MTRQNKLSIVAGLFFAGIIFFFYSGYKPVWQFDHLERNAKKVVSGDDLQHWALEWMARSPDERTAKISDFDTKFPRELLKLAPRLGPRVYLGEAYGTNSMDCVRVVWGSGFLGSTGFEIGPTNFVSNQGHAWQPGVYFFRR